MNVQDQIRALASASSGNYPTIVESSIASAASADVFFADLITAQNREPVLIAMGQQLTAGEILFQTLTAAGSADGGNAGNGALTIQSAGPDAVIDTYTAVCVSARTDRGVFELRDFDGRVLGRINVGTPYVSSVLSLTIADGSADFEVGDKFTIAITGSSTYAAYDFAADPTPPQVATAILAADVDTISAAVEQFATAQGPAIVPAGSLHLPGRVTGVSVDDYNALFVKAAEQLSRCGIVLRGELPLIIMS